MEDKVSIIMPCYNASRYIKESIKSVINQTYDNWELIIIDDKSKDDSLQMIEPFLIDERIILVEKEENRGVAEARNTGIEYSSGRYIAFLDSDDIWDSDKLKLQISFMKSNGCFFSYTSYRIIDSQGDIILSKVFIKDKISSYESLLKSNVIGCLTAVLDIEELGKKRFVKVGHEDYVFWLSYLKTGIKAACLDRVLASYRIHPNTVSSNKWKALKYTWNIYKNVEKLSYVKSCYCLTCQLFQTAKKHISYKLKKGRKY
ncbi:glycosyltransferase family 2 protein [Sphingobacterium sp. DR205]|uniref:glycosyltransferase family 2 protein n=1 Tax=Sphingobacterium sp. DR205 TaxID=2713573 RepID=UPI0013E41E11|nr:glycosyltransferase family 2 protein [Sphingobacterium sp. DR205]QIH31572.1 glycosyltransferase family 2 protein [Sphingobacterium sp. DR205]